MKTINQRLAAHNIKNVDNIGFLKEDYSRFKYGDQKVAKKFAKSLFDYFQEEVLRHYIDADSHLVIYSSPYTYLPTSSLHMTKHFFQFLEDFNERFNFLSKLEFGKIERCQTYSEDYGSMSAEERYDLIKNDTYKLIEVPHKDAVLLFIDDISITGTHQLVIENLLDREGVENKSLYLYFAKLDNPDVSPSFENELNYAYVNSIRELIGVMTSGSFKNTTRTTKFILQLRQQDVLYLLEVLKANNKRELIEEIYEGACKNNYSNMSEYSLNLKLIKETIT